MRDSQRMVFERFGRTYHLRVRTADDLAAVLNLDEALWVATGAPIAGIGADSTLLDFMDTDRNGRIMCFEVNDAIRWALANLRDTAGVTEQSTTLRLDAINTDAHEGRRIRLAAGKILDRLGRSGADAVTLDEIRKVKTVAEAAAVSEAGVVLPDATTDDAVRQFIMDVIATVGAAPHPSGKPGIGQGQLDEFASQARAYLDWSARGRASAELAPFGQDTARAFGLYTSLREKIDQYFAQCRAVAFDPRAAERVGPTAADLQALDLTDRRAVDAFMEDAPLAKPRADCVLALDEQINPAYASRVAEFKQHVVAAGGDGTAAGMSEPEWHAIRQRFAPYQAWLEAKAGTAVEPLGSDTLERYLAPRFADAVGALIAESRTTAIVLDNIRLTETLVLYQANLLTLANNFVSFPYLYDPESHATFDLGALIMDGRRFNLAVRADDRVKHSAIAKTSNMFVIYVEVTPRDAAESPYHVAVPVTAGGKGNLCVGKRGIFQDTSGLEADARVVHIIDNPISVREALASPFQRLAKLLTGKIEAMATVAEKKLDTTATATVTQIQKPVPAPPGGKPSTGLLVGGLLMGGGVAVAAIMAAVGRVIDALKGVGGYKIIIGVAAALLAVMLPMAVVAILKLRRRDLSAILEASGWAINSRMRLTFRQGRYFTQPPPFPKGAKSVHRKRLSIIVAAVVIIAAVATGWYLTQRPATPKTAPTTQPAATAPRG